MAEKDYSHWRREQQPRSSGEPFRRVAGLAPILYEVYKDIPRYKVADGVRLVDHQVPIQQTTGKQYVRRTVDLDSPSSMLITEHTWGNYQRARFRFNQDQTMTLVAYPPRVIPVFTNGTEVSLSAQSDRVSWHLYPWSIYFRDRLMTTLECVAGREVPRRVEEVYHAVGEERHQLRQRITNWDVAGRLISFCQQEANIAGVNLTIPQEYSDVTLLHLYEQALQLPLPVVPAYTGIRGTSG